MALTLQRLVPHTHDMWNLIIIVTADALGPDGARASAETVLTTKSDISFLRFFGCWTYCIHCCRSDKIFKIATALWILAHQGLVIPYSERSGSTLAQVMACCLTAPSHYLKQCQLIISHVLWHSTQGGFTRNAYNIYPWYTTDSYPFNITAISPKDHWVNFDCIPSNPFP